MRSFFVEAISWCWWSWVPAFVRLPVTRLADWQKRRRLQAAVKLFLAQDTSGWTDEMQEVVHFLMVNPCQMLPYSFARVLPKVNVLRDSSSRLYYVVYEDKRLYFPRTWAAAKIKIYFGGLLAEQNVRSPHRYEMAPCAVREGDVVVDAGASEGFFALSVIEKCKKVYLVECDRLWTEPLRKTFEPWRDKVTFLNAWLSDEDNSTENRITLDTLLSDERVDFLKADIEGSECSLLRGAQATLSRSPYMRMAVCAYHTDTDAAILESQLSEAGFSVSYSHGFTIWLSGHGLSLRRGVARAVKRVSEGGDAA